jgi:hypothetical protein
VSIRLLHFDGCPHVRLAEERLDDALAAAGQGGRPVEIVRVDDAAPGDRALFLGSPTLLVDGVDPFAPEGARGPIMGCRMYATEAGPDGAPSVAQLADALGRADDIR